MGYTILLVDDSETIRAMLERTLHMTGLTIEKIIQAQNGKDALAKLAEHWVDIVFTDIHMPEMSGVALIDHMATVKEYADIPVVTISTEGSSARIEELKRKGVSGYIRKPFTPESIRDIILETLGGWDE